MDGYAAAVLFYYGFGKVEADAVTFDIVNIAGGDAVEFVEDMGLLVGGNADAVVCDRYDGVAFFLL